MDADTKVIQQISFTGYLSGSNKRVILFIIEETKEINLDF